MVLVPVREVNRIGSGKTVTVDLHTGKIVIQLLEMKAEQTGVRQQGCVHGLK
jgi:hypothetical protein